MALGLPSRTKQPAEIRTLPFEFADKLAAGDALTGTPTIAIAGADAVLTSAAPVISGTQVLVRLSAGTDQVEYTVTCRVNTTAGDLLELDCLVLVKVNVN